jgi:hypothetical protein
MGALKYTDSQSISLTQQDEKKSALQNTDFFCKFAISQLVKALISFI